MDPPFAAPQPNEWESKPASTQKMAVVVFNFGGPRTLNEVHPFLIEILRDPNTIQLPGPVWVQYALARFIARKRVKEVCEQYGHIGGCSPLVQATERVALDVKAELKPMLGFAPLVLAVHRYLPGWAKAVALGLHAAQVEHIHCLCMYPHFSYATTGSSVEQWLRALRKAGWRGKLTFQRPYPNAPSYVEALADRFDQAVVQHNLSPHDTVVLCSAHGLPKAYVKQGDPYQMHIETSVDALRARFPQWQFRLAYQSKVGPAEWLRPYTEEIIPVLAKENFKYLLFIPVSFVNDHIETLYEVGETYFERARGHGLTPFRCQAIENHPSYIAFLAQDAYHALRGGCGSDATALMPKSQFTKRYGWWLGLVLLLVLWWATMHSV